MQIEDGSHTPYAPVFIRRRAIRKDRAMTERLWRKCRRRLTARAVGTISKQAGLSNPGISGQ